MSLYRARLRRTDFGMTMRGQFALRNSTDLSIVVGSPPTTAGTRAILTGITKSIAKLK